MPAEDFTYSYYAHALRIAKSAGYLFASFSEARELADTPQPVCLLRHDCDNDLTLATRFAQVEAAHDVSATYFIMTRSAMYNPLAGPLAKIIERLRALGHRLGLHFDEELVADHTDAQVREAIDFECEVLERYFGQAIDVVSFHRPSRRVLDGHLNIDRLNTYSIRDVGSYQYVSDSSYVSRIDLLRAFTTRHFLKLHLNLHPEWWAVEKGDITERWKAILASGFALRQDDLWRREDAFLQRFNITLSPHGDPRALPASRVYARYDLD